MSVALRALVSTNPLTSRTHLPAYPTVSCAVADEPGHLVNRTKRRIPHICHESVGPGSQALQLPVASTGAPSAGRGCPDQPRAIFPHKTKGVGCHPESTPLVPARIKSARVGED